MTRALLLCAAFFAFVAAAPSEALPDPAQEARAAALGERLRCTVCQSETTEDSDADMAQDLRRLVREKIAAGWSDQDILDYLSRRYGAFILLDPPFAANTAPLWLGPALVFATGAGALALFLARKERGKKS